MSVALPSTKGGGLLCVTNERWGQHDAPPQLHGAFHCTNAWGAPKGANRHAFMVHECKGLPNIVPIGLTAAPEYFSLFVNTLWGYFELNIGRL